MARNLASLDRMSRYHDRRLQVMKMESTISHLLLSFKHLQNALYGCCTVSEYAQQQSTQACSGQAPLINGLPDSALTASSFHTQRTSPSRSRLHTQRQGNLLPAWRPADDDVVLYIQSRSGLIETDRGNRHARSPGISTLGDVIQVRLQRC